MKEICKNCAHCKPSYKSYYCDRSAKHKKTKLTATCEEWKEKS